MSQYRISKQTERRMRVYMSHEWRGGVPWKTRPGRPVKNGVGTFDEAVSLLLATAGY